MARRFARFSVLASERMNHPGHGSENQRKQQQTPADQAGADKAGGALDRLADHLAEQCAEALGDALHVVGEPAHQVRRALVGERRQVHLKRPAEEELAEVERGKLREPRHQDGVAHHAEALDHGSGQNQADQDCQRLKRVVGQMALDCRFGPCVEARPPPFRLQARRRQLLLTLQGRPRAGRRPGKLLRGPPDHGLRLRLCLPVPGDLLVDPIVKRFVLEDDLDEGIDH